MSKALRVVPLPIVVLLMAAAPCGGGGGDPDAASPDAAPPTDAPTPSDCATATHAPISTDPAIVALARATSAFRRALDPGQLDKAGFCLEDDELSSWSFLPVFVAPRKGIKLSELTADQVDLAYAALDAFLSTQGYDRLHFIINTLDEMLRQMSGGFGFGAGLYHLSLFNDPTTDGAWGFQIDGHHLAITFVVDGDQVYMTPAFFGAQPKTLDGVNFFAAEESLTLALIDALSPDQLARARLGATAPNDVVTSPGNGGPDAARTFDYSRFQTGLRAAELGADQKAKLRALIAQVVGYQDDRFAAAKRAEIDAAFDDTWLAWMGPDRLAGRFYIRIYNPKLVIEYDLTTLLPGNGTEHPHLIIRTPGEGDFGPFALRGPSLVDHLRTDPEHRAH